MRKAKVLSAQFAAYYAVVYLILLATTALFATRIAQWSVATAVVVASALLVYPAIYLLPGLLLTGITARLTSRSSEHTWRRRTLFVVAGASAALTHLLLLMDFGVLAGFGFHFNLFVWNLLTTPGGIESMGLRGTTVYSAIGAIAALLLAHGGLLCWVMRSEKSERFAGFCFAGWRKYAVALGLVLVFVIGSFTFAYKHYTSDSTPLLAGDAIPLYQPVTMKGLFKSIGIPQPERDQLILRAEKHRAMNYPAAPIRRRADRPRHNLVWLVGESWRGDTLDPEIMPRTAQFVATQAVHFKRNYSGGNGTRQGMFSMFYGLHGNYWSDFLIARRGALLLDWLIEDDYDIQCFTSAKFSYPEFDRTIFARLTESQLSSYSRGVTYERDAHNVDRLLEFIAAHRNSSKPFMTFMFFENPHAPYEFPPESALRTNYLDTINYLQVNEAMAAQIKNRYLNACHHMDKQFDRVFSALQTNGMLDRTIVVMAGDHGEEFFEKGYLGHNSSFVQEQVLTPLAIHLPGVPPMIYEKMSAHVDIVPMLAPYFGVENPSHEFSVGLNLLAPGAPERTYTLITDWDKVVFASSKYKTTLPVSSMGAIKQRLSDGEDRPLPSTAPFYREMRSELFKIQRDLSRFAQ